MIELGKRFAGRGGRGQYAQVDAADRILQEYRWSVNTYGYAHARIDGRGVLMHRLILGAKPGEVVDHINGDKLDNRRANIRLATLTLNGHNRRKKAGTTSQYQGVSKSSAYRWRAQISFRGRRRTGCFITEFDAATAYDQWATELHGSAACLNLGGCDGHVA